MRSRVIQMLPFTEVDISAFKKKPEIDPIWLRREMERAAYPFITWSEGTTVAKGDVVECRMSSSCARYDRPRMKITVGAGLLDAQLEERLIGQSVGAEIEAQCRGNDVALTILSVKNKHTPALPDQMVAALDLEGVQTVAEYKRYLIEKSLDETFYKEGWATIQYVIQAVCDNSEILIAEEDWQRYVDWDLGRLEAISTIEGMVLKEMSARDFQGRIPVKSYHELVALVQKDAWGKLRNMLLGRALAEKNGYAVPADGYETFLTDTASAWGHTAEEYRAAYPYEYYEAIEYGNYYFDAVKDYVRRNYFQED